jgi:hypothetical protein
MPCMNDCNKQCCDREPKAFYTKCPNCKRRIDYWTFCGECRHIHNRYVYLSRTLQISVGEALPCLYVCFDCLPRLRSVCYQTAWVKHDFPFSLVRTLGGVGARFEYLHISFVERSYTIRKRLMKGGRYYAQLQSASKN